MNESYKEDNEFKEIVAKVKKDVVGQDVAVEQVCSLIDIGKKRYSLLEEWEVEDGIKNRNYWANIIRNQINEVSLNGIEPRKREQIVENVFEYMSTLLYVFLLP